MALTYHPFKNAKSPITEKPHYGFLLEFVERKKSENICRKDRPTQLFDNVIYQAISWSELSNTFTSYSYTSLVANWEGLL